MCISLSQDLKIALESAISGASPSISGSPCALVLRNKLLWAEVSVMRPWLSKVLFFPYGSAIGGPMNWLILGRLESLRRRFADRASGCGSGTGRQAHPEGRA